MDVSNLAPDLGKLLGLNPATLVLILFVLNRACDIVARLIPNDATGWKAAVRQIASIVGTYVSSRVTSGVSVNDVAAAAATTPPIPAKVAAANEESK